MQITVLKVVYWAGQSCTGSSDLTKIGDFPLQ